MFPARAAERSAGPRRYVVAGAVMPYSDQRVAAPRNHLLAVLPPEVLGRLWPRLEIVELPLRQVLHAVETPIETIYFPETGWISMVAMLENGDGAEVGLVGCEGVVG